MSATNPENSATPPSSNVAADFPSGAQTASQPSPPENPSTQPAHEVSEGIPGASGTSTIGSIPLDLPDFSPRTPAPRNDQAIDLLNDVELNVKIELGRANMLIEDVLRLGQGSVVELDKLAGDPVDVLVNDRLVARGEVLVLNDNFCVRISEIVSGVEEEVVEAGAA